METLIKMETKEIEVVLEKRELEICMFAIKMNLKDIIKNHIYKLHNSSNQEKHNVFYEQNRKESVDISSE